MNAEGIMVVAEVVPTSEAEAGGGVSCILTLCGVVAICSKMIWHDIWSISCFDRSGFLQRCHVVWLLVSPANIHGDITHYTFCKGKHAQCIVPEIQWATWMVLLLIIQHRTWHSRRGNKSRILSNVTDIPPRQAQLYTRVCVSNSSCSCPP